MVIYEALLHTRDGLIYKLQTNDNLFNSLRSKTKFYVNLLMPQHCCDTQIVKSGVKEEKYETSLGWAVQSSDPAWLPEQAEAKA